MHANSLPIYNILILLRNLPPPKNFLKCKVFLTCFSGIFENHVRNSDNFFIPKFWLVTKIFLVLIFANWHYIMTIKDEILYPVGTVKNFIKKEEKYEATEKGFCHRGRRENLTAECTEFFKK